MLKKTLKFAAIGFAIGAVIGNVIAYLTSLGNPNAAVPLTNQLLQMAGGNITVGWILQSLFSGLYGAVCFGTMVFYDIERWPLALATAAHCASIILTFIPVALLLGWVDSLAMILIVAAIQLAAFFLIWLILWSNYRKQIKELNEMQEQFQKTKQESEETNR